MPKIDLEASLSIAELGKALAKAFAVKSGEREADPRWQVSGLVTRVWRVHHPDLPIVKDSDGKSKHVLLQLEVTKDDESGKWLVLAKNNVITKDPQATPRMRVIYESDDATDSPQNWNLEFIAQDAADWFNQQKTELEKEAQALVDQHKLKPGTEPGGQPAGGGGGLPGLGGPLGGPMASRRSRVSSLIERALIKRYNPRG